MIGKTAFIRKFDFSEKRNLTFIVHCVRVLFLALVFCIILFFQLLETRIDTSDFFYPVYCLLTVSFVFQTLFLIFFRTLHKNLWLNSFLFFFEAVYITGLIYFVGIQQSVLIFLYLVNLILCGILLQRKGSLVLALWTSILFSFVVSLDTSLSGNTAYMAVGVNNFTFFTVAYLSGFLSEQFNLMGEQLKESVRDVKILKNLNELVLKNMSSGLITVDNNNLVLQFNPRAVELLQKSDLQGRNLQSLMPGLGGNHPPGKRFDYTFKKGKEKKLWSVTINQLMDASHVLQGRIIHFQDETHVRALERRLRQNEKMAAIGQLAAGIAHEIRNPLAGISGSIQLLRMGEEDKAQSGRLMGIIIREIDRLNHLITEFLDFARPAAPMEDKVNPGSLLREILQFLKNDGLGNDVDLLMDCDEQIEITGNRDKLKQAFLNIIVNAFQAMKEVKSPQFQVTVKREGHHAHVILKDNGVGMNEELRERIFEPFHTTKHKGTGLGLAITHSILENHGAQIKVESEEGKGSEFRILFQT